jgi:hypothetical protein
MTSCSLVGRYKRKSLKYEYYSDISFGWWRAPQQILRTHRSLKASCANPVMKMSSFFGQVLQLMEHQWDESDREEPTTRRKTCPSATLSTKNPTWSDLGSNPGLRGERPATNRLSHGTAYYSDILCGVTSLGWIWNSLNAINFYSSVDR